MIILNPDKEFVKNLKQDIKNNRGYCTCVIVKNEDTICPCRKFREDKECCCGLYMEV